MTVRHRFECARCGHRVHARGVDSAAARQAARVQGADHVNDDHSAVLASSPQWPDELAPVDLLAGDAAYGPFRGWLVPADDLLVCGDCGYAFDVGDASREPAPPDGLVCTTCRERRLLDRGASPADVVESLLR